MTARFPRRLGKNVIHLLLVVEAHDFDNTLIHHLDEPAVRHAEVYAVVGACALRGELHRRPVPFDDHTVNGRPWGRL